MALWPLLLANLTHLSTFGADDPETRMGRVLVSKIIANIGILKCSSSLDRLTIHRAQAVGHADSCAAISVACVYGRVRTKHL